MTMRMTVAVAAALMALAASAPSAQADYIFAGSGSIGNFTGQASEPWANDADFPDGTQPDWGSPGVFAGVTPYLEADTAFGMDLSFTGAGPIDAASIAIGNGAVCAGGTTGGTTFCTQVPNDIWVATLTGPDSISFRAQDPSFFLVTGQQYFVNVFFAVGTTAPTSFTGKWITSFQPNPTPEPATLTLLGAGLAGIGAFRRRKTKA